MAGTVSSSYGAVAGTGDAAPMAEMNTTPLIDVMLVLLIMFIITVPVQSHQVEVALPQRKDIPDNWIRPLRNDLLMAADGGLKWNDRSIDDAQLAGLLAEVANAAKPPEVHFRPDAAARYERVDQVLAIAARSGASTFGFAGNERYQQVF